MTRVHTYLSNLFRLPYVPLVIAALVLLGPVWATGRALFWGTPLLQFVPWWTLAWNLVKDGYLPLWNPLVGMGAPLLANYQSALIYPVNWVYFLLNLLGGAPFIAWGQALVVTFHVIFSGIGVIKLTRRLGFSILAQSVSSLAYSLSGYLIARAGFLSINAAASWLPWVLYYSTYQPEGEKAGNRIVDRESLKLCFCLTMTLLAGHAQTAWYILLLAGIWACWWGRKRLLIALGRFGCAAMLAACLASIQLLPTLEYLSQSQRAAEVKYDLAMTYSLWPWHLLNLISPSLFGNPAQGDYWGYANYWEDAMYIGLLPLILAVAALIRWKRFGKIVWVLTGLVILSFLLALGKNTPIFPWLYAHIPSFDMFQAPARYLIWAVFALAMLAGFGVDRWKRPVGRSLYWTRLGTAGAVAITIAAGVAWAGMGDIRPTFIRASALTGIWGIGIGVLTLIAPVNSYGEAVSSPQKKSAINWQWAVAVFVAIDLVVAGWGLNPGISPEIYRPSGVAENIKHMVSGGRIYLAPKDEEYLKFDRYLRFDTFYPGEDWQNLRTNMLPNTSILDGIASATNFDPLLPGRYTRWMDFLSQVDPITQAKLLNLMDISLVGKLDNRQASNVHFNLIDHTGRTRWMPCVIAADNPDEAWSELTGGKHDLSQFVILEGLKENNGPDCTVDRQDLTVLPPSDEVRLTQGLNPNKLTIEYSALTPGWLLLSDVTYPGWRAWIDGKPTQVYIADYLFRAIEAPAGNHQVEWVYQPISFYLGSIVTFCSMICLVMLWRKFGR